jgi:capsid protein
MAKTNETKKSALKPALARLKYKAVQSDKSRSPLYISSKSEDYELTERDRQTLISESRQLQRDFSLAGFCVRSHLQYVSYYQFNASTPDADFNLRLERKLKRWQHKNNCDVARRHSFPELLYLLESLRVIDGDVGVLRVNDNETGGRIQLIESDRIRNSDEAKKEENWVHGVRVADNGRILAYDVNKRKEYGGFIHERFISAKNMDLIGYFNRADQIRGVSPLAGAIREFSQVQDAISVNLAKSRLEAALGLAVYLDEGSALVEDDVEESEKRVDEVQSQAVDKFGAGVFTFYGTPNEKLEFVQSNNPSSNFQEFITNVTRIVMLALDLPYSFADSSYTNFWGSKSSVNQYIDNVERKQQPTIEFLNDLVFDFLLPNWILAGDIELPTGYTIDDVRDYCGWQGAGKPTWLMLDAVKDMLLAVQSGLLPPSELVNQYGYNIRDNIDDLADILEYAKSKGLSLPYGNSNSQNVGL